MLVDRPLGPRGIAGRPRGTVGERSAADQHRTVARPRITDIASVLRGAAARGDRRRQGGDRLRAPARTGSSRSAAAARSTRARRYRARPGFRSSRSRRPTRAPSGRRASGCATAAPRIKRGGGGARTLAIVYDPALTLDLPAGETAGTSMNALAHCAEALYTTVASEDTDREALAGAKLISDWLPAVIEEEATSRRAGACSRARCTPAPRCARGWGSGTRWRRRSADATGSRTGR